MGRTRGLPLMLAAAILAGCHSGPAAPTPTQPPVPHIRGAQQASPASCPYPSVRPTYLPWLDPGQQIPAPEAHREVGDEGISYAFLEWRNPAYQVSVVRTSQYNLGAPGVHVDMSIEGSDPGELYDGKQPGDTSVYWVIPNIALCSTVALWFSAEDLTRHQARREVRRIAESLRPAD